MRDLQRVGGLCQTKVLCAANLEKQNHASPLKDCPNEQTCALDREISSRCAFVIDYAQQVVAEELWLPSMPTFKEGRHRTSGQASLPLRNPRQPLCLYSLFLAATGIRSGVYLLPIAHFRRQPASAAVILNRTMNGR